MSQLYYFSSSTGADESQYYIKRLALAQRTSDGNHGPSPGFRVTHWSWRGPNMVRQKDHQKNKGFLSLEKATSTEDCSALHCWSNAMILARLISKYSSGCLPGTLSWEHARLVPCSVALSSSPSCLQHLLCSFWLFCVTNLWRLGSWLLICREEVLMLMLSDVVNWGVFLPGIYQANSMAGAPFTLLQVNKLQEWFWKYHLR